MVYSFKKAYFSACFQKSATLCHYNLHDKNLYISCAALYQLIYSHKDVISGGLGGLKPPNNCDDTKNFLCKLYCA